MITGRTLMTLIGACMACGASVRDGAAQCDPAEVRGTRFRFGLSVAAYGDYLAVGSPYENEKRGSVYVYRRAGREWLLDAKLAPDDLAEDDRFGWSVALNGDTLMVGTPWQVWEKDRGGSAYVFRRADGDWKQEAKLVDRQGGPSDRFGYSVSLHGDIASAGAPWKDSSGATFLFKRSGDDWRLESKLVAKDGDVGDLFGQAAALWFPWILIGAPWDDDRGDSSGSAYVFRFMEGEWTQWDKLGEGDGRDSFGAAVSMDAGSVIVGAVFGNTAYVYRLRGDSWVKEARLSGPLDAFAWFGWAVAISGDWAVVGAPDEEVDFKPHGAVYVFRRTDAGWVRSFRFTERPAMGGWQIGHAAVVNNDRAIFTAPFAWGDQDRSKGRACVLDLAAPCDTNCDGSVDLLDVKPFLRLLIGGRPYSPCAGDANYDGSIDLTDVEPFVQCLLNG